MFETLIGKYRNIIVSIALFLLLDASVLLLNFYISFEIADDAAGVNLAGRQRMLSQRTVKSLLDIQYSAEAENSIEPPLKELALTVGLFDTTFNAFDIGGEITGASGELVQLEAVSTPAGRAAIEDAKAIWLPYKVKLDSVLNNDFESDIEFSEALMGVISYARSNNLPLLKLMNDLTVELENVASSKATRLRLIQTVGISLAIINFFIILFHFLRQLRESDEKLEEARKETTEILETVNEGLFLLSRDYVIGSQYSTVLEAMFARQDLGGITFENLLGEIVTAKDMTNAERFVGLLFREDIKRKLIGDLNPLQEVEVNITDEEGHFIHKFFSFSFERVYEGEAIKDVLVTVADVTEKVRLERELALTREQSDKQIEVLTSILHANPDLLKIFVTDVYGSIRSINTILREPSKSSTALRKKLDDVFIQVHRMKGEAAALSLDSFVELTHEFELNIIDVQNIEQLTGDDFLPLVVRLEKLVKHTESVKTLAEKLANFSAVADSANEPSDSSSSGTVKQSWSHLSDLCTSVSSRCGKNVELITSGLSEVGLTDEQRALVNDIAIQCIRNSVIHGVESPEDRLEQSKTESGRVDIRLSELGSGALELVIKDDGYGLDVQRIRNAAIASGNWKEEEIESWDSKRVMSLIFESGLTTEENHSIDAGSGVGMGVIKQRVVEMRGKIRVQSRRGAGTRISVVLPALIKSSVAA